MKLALEIIFGIFVILNYREACKNFLELNTHKMIFSCFYVIFFLIIIVGIK